MPTLRDERSIEANMPRSSPVPPVGQRAGLVLPHRLLVKKVTDRIAAHLPPETAGEVAQGLYEAGLDGLLTAMQMFDPVGNIRFERYAEFRIRAAAMDYLKTLGNPRPKIPATPEQQAREALVEETRGKYAHILTSSDDFIRRKHEELARET